MMTVLIMAVAVVLATIGQLLLKAGMNEVGVIAGVESLRGAADVTVQVLSTWQVLLGLGTFGLSAAFWLVALSRVPLSVAYPVVSVSYVLILVFSVLVLGESPNALVWVGALLVTIGIALIGVGYR